MKYSLMVLTLLGLAACQVAPIEKPVAQKAEPLHVVPTPKRANLPRSTVHIDQVQQARGTASSADELNTAIEKGIIPSAQDGQGAQRTFSQDLPLSDVNAATPVAVILTAPNNQPRSSSDSLIPGNSLQQNYEGNIFQNRPSELQRQQDAAASAAADSAMQKATEALAPGITVNPGN